ncbi:MAG: hypothetical protein ACK5YO_15615, partial [Planctomyces sp.]
MTEFSGGGHEVSAPFFLIGVDSIQANCSYSGDPPQVGIGSGCCSHAGGPGSYSSGVSSQASR